MRVAFNNVEQNYFIFKAKKGLRSVGSEFLTT